VFWLYKNNGINAQKVGRKMGFKVTKITVGKGKTTGDEKAGEWNRQYFEVEAIVEDESQLELAKNSLEALLDLWLRGESLTEPLWDPNKIKWESAEGSSGPYERSEDINNPEFKGMLRDLSDHKGRLTRDGYFYWLFKNGCTVGRKKRVKKAEQQQSNKIEEVKALFPADLQKLLSFQMAEGCCIIRPTQYLGTENFSSIANIVRAYSGEYVSCGRDSHFKIPLPLRNPNERPS